MFCQSKTINLEFKNIIYTFGKIFSMIQRLSTVQYGLKAGMSKQLVLYYIAHNKPLPGVSAIEMIAGRNILHTDLKKLQQMCKNKVS